MKRSMWSTVLLAATVWAVTVQADPAAGAGGTVAPAPLSASSGGPAGFVAGSSREIVEERSEFTALFVNPDGSKTVRSSPTPLHYSTGTKRDRWERIDTAVVADAVPGVLRSKANAWTARFRPLPAGVEFETSEGPLSFAPLGAAAVAPQVTGDGSVVVYPEAWPGVDLRYTVTPTEVKEDMVLKRRPVTSTFQFATGGVEFDATPEGGLVPKGRDPRKGRLAPPEVTDVKGTELSAAKPTMRAVSDKAGARLQLKLDDGFLAGTPDSAYPIIFDPTVQLGSGNMQNHKTYPNGAVASCLSACMLRVGNTVEPWNGALTDLYWRSVGYFDYTQAMGASVVDVSLELVRSPGDGTAAAHTDNVKVSLPNAYSWAGAVGGGSLLAQGTVGENNVGQPIRNARLTGQIAAWARDRVPGGALGFTGLEQPGLFTYKKFSSFILNVTYNPTPPGTPASLTATVQRDGSAVLSFPAAVPDGGGGAVGYEVKAFTGGTQVGGTFSTFSAAPVTWNGLVDGAVYTFTVQAFNTVGASGVRSSPPVTATRYAAAPANVRAWPGNATAWVTWDPADPRGGPAVTGYEVYLCKADASVCLGPTPSAGQQGRAQVNPPGTVNGVGYFAVVRAVTARGAGDNGLSPILTLSAGSAPFPVQQASASAGSGTRTWIGWHPPQDNGAGPLTKYVIWRLVNGVHTQSWDNIPATPPPGGTIGTYEITNLADTRPSTYEVYPFNANGYVGAPGPGPATAQVTPAANAAPYPSQRPPGSTDPVNRPALEVGDGQVVLRWAPPAANGATGSCPTPTGYAAFLVDRAGGPNLSQIVTGLNAIFTTVPVGAGQPGIINGHTYTGVVYSLNSSGGCAASGQSGPVVTGTGTPQAGGNDLLNATDPVAVRGDQQANLSWKPAGLALGLATYTIKATPGPANTPTNPAPSVGPITVTTEAMTGGPRLNRTIGGLRNGTTYTFTVTANLVLGLVSTTESPPSEPITPAGRPFPARIGTATRGDQSATVTWDPPADDPTTGIPGNNGDPITRYDVQVLDEGFNVTSTKQNVTRGGTVGPLTNGARYTFRVLAVNSIGISSPSASSNEVIPAGKPFPPVDVFAQPGPAQPGSGYARVSWFPARVQPSGVPGNNGDPIVRYTVTARPDSGPAASATTTGTAVTIYGLANGMNYTFTVTATNGVGTSNPSEPSNRIQTVGEPDPPTNLVVLPGDGQLTARWTPGATNGTPITGYTVTVTPTNGGDSIERTVGAGTTTLTVTGLANGTNYAMTVVATSAAGPSLPATSDGTSAPPPGPPGLILNAGLPSQVAEQDAVLVAQASPGTQIGFRVAAGPNVGATGSCWDGAGSCLTNNEGAVYWTYTSGPNPGDDTIEVYLDNNANGTRDSGEAASTVTKTWYRYVALGDSFPAGEGVEPYFSGTAVEEGPDKNKCHRSSKAHPFLRGGNARNAQDPHGGAGFTFLACSGAEIKNVGHSTSSFVGAPVGQYGEPIQLDAQPGVNAETGLVTLNIGGNNMRFSDVLTACARRSCLDEPFGGEATIGEWLTKQADALVGPLTGLYMEVKQKAGPNTSILVTGYPHLFPSFPAEQDCPKLIPFRGEQTRLNESTDYVNDRIREAAAAAGVWYVDVRPTFAGHEVCGRDGEWISGPTLADEGYQNCNLKFDLPIPAECEALVGSGSFHPNRTGQVAYSRAIASFIDSKVQLGSTLTPAGLPTNPSAQ